MRASIVGTSCTIVTRWAATAASTSSASKCVSTTTSPPMRNVPSDQPSGAAWYSGAGDRYTVSAPRPQCARNGASGFAVPATAPESGRRTPLGRPVVPDE